jgi:hypothetical protein
VAQRPVTNPCEQGHGGEYLDQLSDYQLLHGVTYFPENL